MDSSSHHLIAALDLQHGFRLRLIRSALTCLLLVNLAPDADAAPMLGMDVIPGRDFNSALDQTFGYSFTTTVSFNVIALGLLDRFPDGLVEDHPIGLWTAAGTLLASGNIEAGPGTSVLPSVGNAQRWHISDIPDITLPAGDYVIGALYPSNPSGDPFLLETLLPDPAPGVAYTGLRYAVGSSLAFPNLTESRLGIFGPTFVIDDIAGSVPAPATLALLGLGLAALGFTGRKTA